MKFPKAARLISNRMLRLYRARHPLCELRDCWQAACPEPHHLRGRKMGRDDCEANLLSLCQVHHEAWHRLGRRTWYERYAGFLHEPARAKVARVVGAT